MSNLKLIIMVLDEVRKMRVSCIYRIGFPDGKYYVGKSKNLRERVRLYERKLVDLSDNSRVMSALREFGIGNVSWDILSCVDVCDADDLDLCLSILEIKYIRENDCIYPNGYNTSIGGELLGIPTDVINAKFGVDAGGYAGKSVLVYDKDGNFVSEHLSVGKCAYALGVSESLVSNAMDKIALIRNTYMVREKKYVDIPKKILPFKPDIVIKRKTEYNVVTEKVFKKKTLENASIMYDTNGDYIGLFESSTRSKHYLGLRADWKVPYGREFHGYYLLHYNGGEIKKSLGAFTSKILSTTMYDDILALGDTENIGDKISFKIPEVDEDFSKKPKRSVNKYTVDGEYIETYDSIADAAEANGVLDGSIRSCCNRKTKTCGGFIYRFADDDKPVVMKGKVASSQEISRSGRRKYRKVNQYTLGGKFVRTYNSVVEAALFMGVFASGVRACCNGKVSRCGDFRYFYADEDGDMGEKPLNFD